MSVQSIGKKQLFHVYDLSFLSGVQVKSALKSVFELNQTSFLREKIAYVIDCIFNHEFDFNTTASINRAWIRMKLCMVA